jgi:hypothetical protein
MHMKHQADKQRSKVSYEVGDKVYLKLRPYVQTSLANRSHQKLAFKFFGPYTITDKVGAVAYRLHLPEGSSVHPVFHASHLKKCVSPMSQVSSVLSTTALSYQVPERVLSTRRVCHGDSEVSQLLVKWSQMALDLATWEDEEAIRQQFPQAPAWGQARTQGWGVLTARQGALQLTGHHTHARRTRRCMGRIGLIDWGSVCEAAGRLVALRQ